MSTEGAKVLCNALVHNDELSDLTLMWNNLGNKGCNIIANAVTINQLNWSFPFSINLAYNTIGEEGATILANALRTNNLITKLDLKGNNIYCAGASALAASLKFNTVLEELNLQCNGISDRGAIEIADTLAVNNVIKSLDLWGNPVRHRGAMALAEGIVQSMPGVCLQHLRVDEFWLPIKPLLGVELERSLDFRESCLGVLDAIIIAIFMKENKEVSCEQRGCARVCAFKCVRADIYCTNLTVPHAFACIFTHSPAHPRPHSPPSPHTHLLHSAFLLISQKIICAGRASTPATLPRTISTCLSKLSVAITVPTGRGRRRRMPSPPKRTPVRVQARVTTTRTNHCWPKGSRPRRKRN